MLFRSNMSTNALLQASNVPKSSEYIKPILLPGSITHFTAPPYHYPKRSKLSSKETDCSNVSREEKKSFTKRPPVFLRIPLKPQTKDTLLRFPSLHRQQLRY